jgi:hypothetical protein
MEGCKSVCLLKNKLMTYRWVFWGNSYHSSTAFKLQKKSIRIMVGIRDRESCREYFRKLKVLPLQSQYIYLLLLFVINNRQHFKINSDIHNINTRTCTIHGLICQFTRRVYFILGLRYLTDYLFQKNNCPMMAMTQNNLIELWKVSYIFILFIHSFKYNMNWTLRLFTKYV